MRPSVPLAFAFAFAFALVVTPVVPAACSPAGKITIEARFPATGSAPPEAGASGGACLSTPFAQVDDHVIPRGTDNVTVHFHMDLGASVPTIGVSLTGLGLTGQTFTMSRVLEDLGTSHRYAMDGFATVAPAVPGDTITASVTTPLGTESATYRVV